MKLQLAIDRVSVEKAINIIEQTDKKADIIEVGTSLIKDYGISESVQKIKQLFPEQIILADLKTTDEGEYEFRRVFEAGADIATVMGNASVATISACRNVTHEFGREYMIDLLEVPQEKLEQLKNFEDAIFCVHLPSDKMGEGLEKLISETCGTMAGNMRLAVAGGVKLETLELIRLAGFEIVIIGSAITKSENIRNTVDLFSKKIQKGGM